MNEHAFPAIDPSLLKKTFTTTPQHISKDLLGLCTEISPNDPPVFLDVEPDSDALPNECFNNVQRKVDRDGGTILYGWALWEWPMVLIEAEHHAVWQHRDKILDITPHAGQETRILFLPTPNQGYDFKEKTRRKNIKRSLGVIPEVRTFIDATDKFHDYIETNSIDDRIVVNKIELHEFQKRISEANAQILLSLARKRGRNDTCICNSGMKFKKCCKDLIKVS